MVVLYSNKTPLDILGESRFFTDMEINAFYVLVFYLYFMSPASNSRSLEFFIHIPTFYSSF